MVARKAKPAETRGSQEPTKAAASSTKRTRTVRRRYTDTERRRMLETARREGLSGPKAAKRFGISTLTFYNWRKKASGGRRGRSIAARGTPPSSNGIASLIREQIQGQIRKLLPEIVRAEVDAALSGVSGRRR